MICVLKKASRNCSSVRMLTTIFVVGCFLHVNQIYLESQIGLDNTKQRKNALFLFQQENVSRNRSIRRKHAKIRLRFGNSPGKSCAKTKSVLFVKTHKTGSTTITNVILRYAFKNNLTVGLPLPKHWQLGGYPSRFDSKLVLPRLPKYDVLCHHIRYDHKSVQNVLEPGTIAITILRDPANGFESGFSFFRDWPYSKWFENITKTENLQLFLDYPYKYYNNSTPWYFRAKNYMSFDLGFDHERDDLKYARMAISKMEERFDLVLITERMDESLLLLKDLLCMKSLNEISYLRLKVRQDFARRRSTEKMQQQMRSWNFLDYKLYYHFNRSLDKRIQEYGRERMKRDIQKFRKLIENTEKNCVLYYDQYQKKPWVSRIKLKENVDEMCTIMSWGEVKFGEFIREYQQSYVDTVKIHQPSQEEMNLLFQNAQRKVIGSEAALNSA